MTKALATGATVLALLGGCLATAQASEGTGPIGASAEAAAGGLANETPPPTDVDEFSEELNGDDISLPLPDMEEGTPSPLGGVPGDEATQEEGIGNPDPYAAAGSLNTTCQARLLAATRAGSNPLVACANWDNTPLTAPLRAAVSAWPTPEWCDDRGVNGGWYVNRFRACGIFSAILNVIDTRTGATTGTLNYLVRAYAYSERNVGNWAYQVELMQVSATGEAVGMSASGKATCTGKCKVTDSKFPSQAMSSSKDAVGQFILQTNINTSIRGQKGEGQATAAWVFTGPRTNPSNEIALPTPSVRCDTAYPGPSLLPGCVMPYIPELVYNKAGEYPQLAQHIEDAQNIKNLPGKHGTTNYLTRLTDQTKIDANRNTACPKSIPRPLVASCDEYPFASTWQGAFTGGGNYSMRMIDAKQNSGGGRTLGGFYLYNRILEKDRFLVWIK
jgi:hypothetical protein